MLRSLCGCLQAQEKGDSSAYAKGEEEGEGGGGPREDGTARKEKGEKEEEKGEKAALNGGGGGGGTGEGEGAGGQSNGQVPSSSSGGDGGGGRQSALGDALKMSLLSIRARRRLIANIPTAEEVTRFDDDVQVDEEDAEGDETHVLVGGTYCGQDYERLRAACLRTGRKFVDPEFPPCDVSLFFDTGHSDPTIEWKRPGEICTEPQLVQIYHKDYIRKKIAGLHFLSALWHLRHFCLPM